MKVFFTTILAVVCLLVLIAGNWHWNKQNNVSGIQKKAETESPEITANPDSNVNDELIRMTSNWPAQGKESFKMALEEKRPFTILIVGSENTGWASIAKNKLIEAYGANNLSVEIIQYTETTKQFAEEMVSGMAEKKRI